MQSLCHLDRIVRHAIHDALKENETLTPEQRQEIRGLAKDFRQNLRDTFLAAGQGHDFDPTAILPGISSAVKELTEGLRALRGAEPDLPPAEPPVKPAPVPYDPVAEPPSEPGGLVALTA